MSNVAGFFFLVVIVAIAAIGSVAVFGLASQNPQTSDNYGDAFPGITNTSTQIGADVAAPVVEVQGYLLYVVIAFLLVGAIIGFAAFILKGGSGGRPIR